MYRTKKTIKKNIQNKSKKTIKNGGAFFYTTHDVEIFYPRKFLGKLLPSKYATKDEASAPTIEWPEIFNIPEIRFKTNGNYLIVGDIYDLTNNKKTVFIQQRIQMFFLPNINHTIKPIEINKLNEFYKSVKDKTPKATTKIAYKIYSLGKYKHKLTLQQAESYLRTSISTNHRRSIFGINKTSTKQPVEITKDLTLQLVHTYYFRLKIK